MPRCWAHVCGAEKGPWAENNPTPQSVSVSDTQKHTHTHTSVLGQGVSCLLPARSACHAEHTVTVWKENPRCSDVLYGPERFPTFPVALTSQPRCRHIGSEAVSHSSPPSSLTPLLGPQAPKLSARTDSRGWLGRPLSRCVGKPAWLSACIELGLQSGTRQRSFPSKACWHRNLIYPQASGPCVLSRVGCAEGRRAVLQVAGRLPPLTRAYSVQSSAAQGQKLWLGT